MRGRLVSLAIVRAIGPQWPLALATCLVVGFYGLLLARDLPIGGIDESFYKGVAFELATRGTWTLHSALGLHPDLDTFFVAGYPPLYMVSLAGWYRLAAFGLTQGLAFPLALHAATACLAGILTARLSTQHGNWWGAVACLASAAYLRTDRPDPAALCLVLLTLVLIVKSRRPTPRRALIISVAWAGALLVQPVATVLYGLLVTVVLLLWYRWRTDALRIIVAAAILVVAIEGAMFIRHPNGFRYFLKSATAAASNGPRSDLFLTVLKTNWYALPWFILAVVGLVLLACGGRWRTMTRSLAISLVAVLALWGMMWPLETYLMLTFPLVVVTVCVSWQRFMRTRSRRLIGATCIGAALGVAWLPSFVLLLRSASMVPHDRYETSRLAVQAHIPPGSIVMGDSPTWTMLVERYRFFDTVWGERHYGEAAYVVSAGYGSRRLGISNFEVAHPKMVREFALVYDGIDSVPQTIGGWTVGRSRVGYGVRIFQRVSRAVQESTPK